MKCDYQNREGTIAEYLMNRLSEEEAARFQEHFFNCEVCFQEVRLQRSAISLIKTEGDSLFRDYLERRARENPFVRLWNWLFKKNRSQKNRLIFGGVALAFILLISVLFWFKSESEPDLLAKIDYSQSVPVDFQPPDIFRRGPAELPAQLSAVRSFYDSFSSAMLEYKDCKYDQTIDKLEAIHPQAEALIRDQPQDERAVFATAQYYFYLGVSHLAQARNKAVNLTKESEKNHLEKAIQFISKSNELATRDLDKNRYFLGLAYGFAGKQEAAVEQLKQIPGDSQFHEKSSTLLEKWSGEGQ